MKTPQEHHDFSLSASKLQEALGRTMTVVGDSAPAAVGCGDGCGPNLPRAIAHGTLTVFDPPVPCAVLPGGVRALGSRGTLRALTGGGAKDGHLSQFLARISGDSSDFKVGPISYVANGGAHVGITDRDFQRLITHITDLALAGKLHHKQRHIADNARRMEKALVGVGLAALIDEATGFQAKRQPSALAELFRQYLLDERGGWEPEFPADLYLELAKVYRYPFELGQHERPKFFASWTWRYVYSFLPNEVRAELRARNPENAHRHHQHLTPTAKQVLRNHFLRLITVLRQSDGPDDFARRFDREFRGGAHQMSLAYHD